MLHLEQEIDRIIFEGYLEGDYVGLVTRSIAEMRRYLKFVHKIVHGEVVVEIGKETSMYEAVMNVAGCLEGTSFDGVSKKALNYLKRVRRDLDKDHEKILYRLKRRWVLRWHFFFLHDNGYVSLSFWLLPASSLIKSYYLSSQRKRHFVIRSGLISLRHNEKAVLDSFMRVVRDLNERGWQ
jgi:hypothetical protein